MANKLARFAEGVLRLRKKKPTKGQRARPKNQKRKPYRGQGRV